MAELTIPKEHQPKFVYFISLSDEIKLKLFDSVKNTKKEISPRLLVEHIYSTVSELEKDKIFDLVIIYLNLINAKNSFGVPLKEFMILLEQALADTKVKELLPNNSILADFEKLLISGSEFADVAKVMGYMTENQRTFLDVKIYQDIRTVFNENQKIIGSAIINNLKILFKEDGINKELYFSLDNKDMNKLFEKIKIAQENIQVINENFANAKII